MIRIKIRSCGEITGKVLRFDKSIEFHALLRKIIDKLGVGVTHQIYDGDDDPSQLFQLRLGGDSVLEDTNEIEHGDELVLMRIGENDDDDGEVRKECSDENVNSDKIKTDNDDDDVESDSKPAAKISQDSQSSTIAENNIHSVKKESTANDIEEISISSDEDEEYDEDDDESIDEEDYESSSSEDEDEKHCSYDKDKNTRPSKRRKRNPRPPPESPLEVIIDEKDVPSAPGRCDDQAENRTSNNTDNGDLEEVSLLVDRAGKKKSEQEVKHRIIKLLNTGFHDQSNEHEAKNAMKLAQRLMRKYNLSQALLLKERELKNDQTTQDGEVLKGGMVRVRIVNRKTRKASLLARWISHLINPVCKNFGVKSYHQKRRGVRCDVIFYGIYSNAQLAGYAFKVATERIAQMSAEYKPEKSWRNISTKSSRLSYALGIVQGISEDVEKNIRMEKDQRQRKLERARVAGSKGEAYAESDDDDDGIDNEGTGISIVNNENKSSDEIPLDTLPNHTCSSEVNIDPNPKSISGTDLKSRLEELEKEEQAVLVLVDHSEKIAEEVLKEHGIKKLSYASKRKAIDFDRQSYNQGIEDSKEIDMNQRAIRDGVKVKTEKTKKEI